MNPIYFHKIKTLSMALLLISSFSIFGEECFDLVDDISGFSIAVSTGSSKGSTNVEKFIAKRKREEFKKIILDKYQGLFGYQNRYGYNFTNLKTIGSDNQEIGLVRLKDHIINSLAEEYYTTFDKALNIMALQKKLNLESDDLNPDLAYDILDDYFTKSVGPGIDEEDYNSPVGRLSNTVRIFRKESSSYNLNHETDIIKSLKLIQHSEAEKLSSELEALEKKMALLEPIFDDIKKDTVFLKSLITALNANKIVPENLEAIMTYGTIVKNKVEFDLFEYSFKVVFYKYTQQLLDKQRPLTDYITFYKLINQYGLYYDGVDATREFGELGLVQSDIKDMRGLADNLLEFKLKQIPDSPGLINFKFLWGNEITPENFWKYLDTDDENDMVEIESNLIQLYDAIALKGSGDHSGQIGNFNSKIRQIKKMTIEWIEKEISSCSTNSDSHRIRIESIVLFMLRHPNFIKLNRFIEGEDFVNNFLPLPRAAKILIEKDMINFLDSDEIKKLFEKNKKLKDEFTEMFFIDMEEEPI